MFPKTTMGFLDKLFSKIIQDKESEIQPKYKWVGRCNKCFAIVSYTKGTHKQGELVTSDMVLGTKYCTKETFEHGDVMECKCGGVVEYMEKDGKNI